MNRKQFLILIVALLVLGGAGMAIFWQDIAAYRSSGAKIGARIFPALKLADVSQLRLRDAEGEVTLMRKGERWVVKERGDYPANVQEISDLLIKLSEMKVVQSETVGVSLLPRVNLVAPPTKPTADGKKPEGVGTLLELADGSGKVLASMIAGTVVKKKDPGNPLPIAQDGVPAGRYILLGDAKDTVSVVSDPLNAVEARAGRWLSKDFFKAERIRNLNVAGDGAVQWRIARDLEYGQWAFAAGGGPLNPSAAVGAVNALGSAAFSDVATDIKPEDQARVATVTAETFDNLTYVLTIARKAGQKDGDYLMNVKVSGTPPAKRVPEKGEKPEEVEKRDKQFAEELKKLQQKVAREQELGSWTYVVEEKALAPLLRPRPDMLIPAKPQQQQQPPA